MSVFGLIEFKKKEKKETVAKRKETYEITPFVLALNGRDERI